MQGILITKRLKNRYNNVVNEMFECGKCGAYVYDRKQTHCDVCGSKFIGTKVDEVDMKPSEEQIAEYIHKQTDTYPKRDKKGLIICPTCNNKNYVLGQAHCMYCGQAFKW